MLSGNNEESSFSGPLYIGLYALRHDFAFFLVGTFLQNIQHTLPQISPVARIVWYARYFKIKFGWYKFIMCSLSHPLSLRDYLIYILCVLVISSVVHVFILCTLYRVLLISWFLDIIVLIMQKDLIHTLTWLKTQLPLENTFTTSFPPTIVKDTFVSNVFIQQLLLLIHQIN